MKKRTTCLPSRSPVNLMCSLIEYPAKTEIANRKPSFSWSVPIENTKFIQTAYQILVASTLNKCSEELADIWNSEKISSSQSASVLYSGKPLEGNSTCYWKVKVWGGNKTKTAFSEPQKFAIKENSKTTCYPLEIKTIKPVLFHEKGENNYFIDFGKDAFGTIELNLGEAKFKKGDMLDIHLGEKIKSKNVIDTSPPGSVRYKNIKLKLIPGEKTYKLKLPDDKRNTGPLAISIPKEIGQIFPFRYCEIRNSPFKLNDDMIKQLAVFYHFDDEQCHFCCSDKTMNDLWEFCKYSIKATSFSGIYVDGDRERIPYEADAYINQLGHYCVDKEFTMARATQEHFFEHPTWFTEWHFHSIFMAWMDYLHTGDLHFLRRNYDTLKNKLLLPFEQDGLFSSDISSFSEKNKKCLMKILKVDQINDLVDWPPEHVSGSDQVLGERDGHEMMKFNTVVNAFFYQSLTLMHNIAQALNLDQEKLDFQKRMKKVYHRFNENFFDDEKEIYIDGIGSKHSSLHSNMFALLFGLVPPRYREKVLEFVKSRGMACSVYGAQYLLELLYEFNDGNTAFDLLNSTHDRSWAHMMYNVGTTITMEVWDMKYKPNLDWNHAWGAAPANIIPRFLMGIRATGPAFSTFIIKPQLADIKKASIQLATIKGIIKCGLEINKTCTEMYITIPGNTIADVYMPVKNDDIMKYSCNGRRFKAKIKNGYICIRNLKSGNYDISTV